METKQVKAVQLGTMNEGTSSKGAWVKQELIVETIEQYPKTICVLLWNDVAKFVRENVKQGMLLSLKLEISSREYNGKWYTDVTGRDVEITQPTQPITKGQKQATTPADDFNDDDLPF